MVGDPKGRKQAHRGLERLTMIWNEMLDDARKLPQADLERHASISTNARHRCQACFTCAAEEIRWRREDARAASIERYFQES